MFGFCCLFKISRQDEEKLLSILNGPWMPPSQNRLANGKRAIEKREKLGTLGHQ